MMTRICLPVYDVQANPAIMRFFSIFFYFLIFFLLFFTMSLRKDAVIPFIGESESVEITGSQFPTSLQVFQYYKYLTKTKTAAEARNIAAKAAEEFWRAVGATCKSRKCVVDDILKMAQEHEVDNFLESSQCRISSSVYLLVHNN